MKAHIGADAESGLAHTVTTMAANLADIAHAAELLQAKRRCLCGCGLYGGGQARGDRRLGGMVRGRQVRQAQGVAAAAARVSSVGRAAQGADPGQGRAPVPGDQAAVRLCEGALPRIGEEHGTDRHPVRLVEPVDGATNAIGQGGEIASAVGLVTTKRPGNG